MTVFPRPFEYLAPSTIDEAVSALARNPGAKVLAGGMSLIPMMKLRVLSPPMLVDIGRLPGLDSIANGPTISIPALVCHRDVAGHQAVRARATALAEAAASAGDPQVRARGTTCGSVVHADAAGDQPAALLALGGSVLARSPAGTRRIAAEDFFVDMFTTALGPDEIVERIEIPSPAPGTGSAYAKIGRRGTMEGFPVAAAAAWVRLEGGVVAEARLALAGVGLRPILSPAVAERLTGSRAEPAAISAAASAATEGVTILADLHGDRDHKARLAAVMTERAVARALDRALADLRQYDIAPTGGG